MIKQLLLLSSLSIFSIASIAQCNMIQDGDFEQSSSGELANGCVPSINIAFPPWTANSPFWIGTNHVQGTSSFAGLTHPPIITDNAPMGEHHMFDETANFNFNPDVTWDNSPNNNAYARIETKGFGANLPGNDGLNQTLAQDLAFSVIPGDYELRFWYAALIDEPNLPSYGLTPNEHYELRVRLNEGNGCATDTEDFLIANLTAANQLSDINHEWVEVVVPFTYNGTQCLDQIAFRSLGAAMAPSTQGVGCQFIDDVSLTLVNQGLNLTLNQDQCTNIITANVQSNCFQYTWMRDGIIIPANGPDWEVDATQPGNYTLDIVTGGCYDLSESIVSNPTNCCDLVVVPTSGETDACTANDGFINVFMPAGYTIDNITWDVAGLNGLALTGLSSGTYSVTIDYNGGCSLTETITVVDNFSDLQLVATTNTPTCDNPDIHILSTPSGGTAPYTFGNLLGGTNGPLLPFSTSGDFGFVECNTSYSLTVTDAAGCSETINITTPACPPNPPVIASTVTDASCPAGNPSNGQIILNGGTANTQYTWFLCPSGNCNGTTVNNAVPGTYVVQWQDGTCNGTEIITVNATNNCCDLVVVPTSGEADACTANDGFINVFMPAGYNINNITWNVPGLNGLALTGLSSGTYSVTIDYNGGCSLTETITVVDNFSDLQLVATTNNPTCDSPDIHILSTPSGGTAPYTFGNLLGGTNGPLLPFSTSGDFGFVECNTTYSLTVTDAAGCSQTINITTPACPPTPPVIAATVTDASCPAGNPSNGQIVLNGGTGNTQYNWFLCPSGNCNGTTVNNAVPGTYVVQWQDGTCNGTEIITVNDNSVPVDIVMNNSGANCTDNAFMVLDATGGSINYNWSITPAATGPFFGVYTALTCGIPYTVTIDDGSGCPYSETFTIPCPPVATFSATFTDETCPGDEDGTISTTINGGIGPYTVTLNPGGFTGTNFNNLGAGVYTLDWVDNGSSCSGSETLTIGNDCPSVGLNCNLVTDGAVNNPTPNIGQAIATHPDGSYTVAGNIHQTANDQDHYLVNLDATDAMQYSLRFGDEGGAKPEETFNDVISWNGSDYAVGTSKLVTGAPRDIVITKHDPNNPGASWIRSYDFFKNSDDVATSIVQFQHPTTQQELLAVAGYSDGESNNTYRMFLMIIREDNGAPLGTMNNPMRRYIGTQNLVERCNDLVYLPNTQQFVLVGTVNNRGCAALVNLQPFSIANNGNLMIYTNPNSAFTAIDAVGNGVYVTGTTSSNGAVGRGALVMRLNIPTMTPAITNHYHFSNSSNMSANDIIIQSDGNLLIAGGIETPAERSSFAARILAGNFSLDWALQSNRVNFDDEFFGLSEQASGHIMMTGYSEGSNQSLDEIFVARVASDGTSCCMNPIGLVSLTPGTLQPFRAGIKGGSMNIQQLTQSTTWYSGQSLCVQSKNALAFNEEKNDADLRIYPNPSNGLFKIEALGETEILTIELYSATGKLIPVDVKLKGAQLTIDLSAHANGLYLVRARLVDGTLITKRVTISK